MWPQALHKGNTQKEASRLSFSCLLFTFSSSQAGWSTEEREDRQNICKSISMTQGPKSHFQAWAEIFTRANASWFSDSLPVAASLQASECLRTERATKLIFKYLVVFKKKYKSSSCDSTSAPETMRWARCTTPQLSGHQREACLHQGTIYHPEDLQVLRKDRKYSCSTIPLRCRGASTH